jgi:HK97 family phage major capsid protein
VKTLEAVRDEIKQALEARDNHWALRLAEDAIQERRDIIDNILAKVSAENRSDLLASEQREFDAERQAVDVLDELRQECERRAWRDRQRELGERRSAIEASERMHDRLEGTGRSFRAVAGASSIRPLSHDQAIALRSIETDALASDAAKQAATELVERDETDVAARWASVASNPDYLSAFTSMLVDPERGHLEWTPQQRQAWTDAQMQSRAMNIGTDASGGYLVPFSLDPVFTLTNDGTINPLRRIARTTTIATDKWNGITTAGVTAEWKAEAAEVADASPSDLAQPSIPVHMADTYVVYSFESEQDIPSLVDELQTAMTDGRDRLEATAFTTGDGSGKPKGIITAVAADAGSLVTPTTAETFAVADVYKVAAALPPRHQANAQWAAAYATELSIRQFASGDGANHAFWSDLGGGTPPNLLGKPWNQVSDMDGTYNPAATAANYLLLFGDFSKYMIVDRIGTTVEIVPHVLGSNRRPTGQRGLLMYWRVGADCLDTNAFRLLNVATTA